MKIRLQPENKLWPMLKQLSKVVQIASRIGELPNTPKGVFDKKFRYRGLRSETILKMSAPDFLLFLNNKARTPYEKAIQETWNNEEALWENVFKHIDTRQGKR